MIEGLVGFIKGLVKKVAMPLIFALAIFVGWDYMLAQQANRSFTTSFFNVHGLADGAPVYAMGSRIGRVTKIFPLLDGSNKTAVQVLITKKGFPVPGEGTKMEIVPSSERSGSRVLELSHITPGGTKGYYDNVEPLVHNRLMRVAFDFFQMSKDFADYSFRQFKKPEFQHYQSQIKRQVSQTMDSIQNGTLKEDFDDQIKRINKLKVSVEKDQRGIITEKEKKSLMTQIKALDNTLRSTMSVSDLYKN